MIYSFNARLRPDEIMGVPLYFIYALFGFVVSIGTAVIAWGDPVIQLLLFCVAGGSAWFGGYVLAHHKDWFLIRAKRKSRQELSAKHFLRGHW